MMLVNYPIRRFVRCPEATEQVQREKAPGPEEEWEVAENARAVEDVWVRKEVACARIVVKKRLTARAHPASQ